MNRANCLSIAATLMTLGLSAMAGESNQLSVDPAAPGYVSARVQLSQAQPAPGTVQPAPPAAGGAMGHGMMGGMGQSGGGGMMGMGQGRTGGMMGMGQGGMGRMMGMDMMEMGGGMGQSRMSQVQPGAQQGAQMGAPVPGQPTTGTGAMGPSAMGPGAMSLGAMGMGRGPMAGPMASTAAAEPIDRIEGRIAFLRAELKITDAQTAAWNEFAEAVRAGARRHNEMREHMMAASPGTVGMAARLEQHERMLNGRLESTRSIRASLGRLQAVLNEDQRRTLDELMTVL